MSKIKVKNPIVELDGDEMTRVVWDFIKNKLTNQYDEIPKVARDYRKNKIYSIIVGEENYGEGSSREHAAMEPRFMNIKAVIVKSFARIHETNLKKQGILGLVFDNKTDYNKILEDDTFNILGLKGHQKAKKGENTNFRDLYHGNENDSRKSKTFFFRIFSMTIFHHEKINMFG